jgi:hypothetical protein
MGLTIRVDSRPFAVELCLLSCHLVLNLDHELTMDLEGLLNASLDLEKRIARDKMLRQCFSNLWKENRRKLPVASRAAAASASPSARRQMTLGFPSEMCELLELASSATGKTASEILEESFVDYYLKKIAPAVKV